MAGDVEISISRDEALVLFELLSRFSQSDQLSLRHNSEFVSLHRVLGQLEKELVEPFQENYSSLLEIAQARVASGFEGNAPGVCASSYSEIIECSASPNEGVLFVKAVVTPHFDPVELDTVQARKLAALILASVEQIEAGWVGGENS